MFSMNIDFMLGDIIKSARDSDSNEFCTKIFNSRHDLKKIVNLITLLFIVL